MLFACIGTAVGFFGRHWWVFELASHFPLQYLAILITSGLIYLYLGNFRTAIIAGAFALANLYLIVPFNTEVHAKAPSTYRESRKFRALLINVNNGNHDYEKVRKYIRTAQPDFIVLLELNEAWMEELRPIKAAYPYEKSMALESFGIGLFSHIPFENATIKTIERVGLPSVIAQFYVDKQHFTLVGTHPYPPVSQTKAKIRNQQIAALGQLISSQQGTTIVLGDLNITPWSPFFRDFLAKTGMRDSRVGFGLQPSWPVRFPPFWIPIDHCLVSPNVIVHNRTIGPDIGSDHYPVVVDFSVTSRLEVVNKHFG
jgi:endonuclease/exonuclease/phosphatase (EEP) superfamily protein YafD